MIEKPFIEPLADKKLLRELPFYKNVLEGLNVPKHSKVFKNYAHSYTVEVLNSQGPASQFSTLFLHLKLSNY